MIIMCVEKSAALKYTPVDMKPVCILSCGLTIARNYTTQTYTKTVFTPEYLGPMTIYFK